jgi:SAM-dependent methyltransferase
MSASNQSSPQHWPDIARRWSLVGPPLRPSARDIRFYCRTLNLVAARPLRALILGVTPELYHLPWPAGTDLMAADHTPGMIAAVWPGRRDQVMCAEWTDLPLPAASRDVVLCDGGLHLLSYPAGQKNLAREMARIIAPGGLCVLRLFVPSILPESVDEVLDDLLAGRVPNVNVLKLRLAMAIQLVAEQGVELRRVWDALHGVAPELYVLAARIGWPIEPLRAIETYRDSPVRYWYVTENQATDLFCRGGAFELVHVSTPRYPFGGQCPTVVLRRLPR